MPPPNPFVPEDIGARLMFLNRTDFPFALYLEENFAAILREADSLSADEFSDWPIREAYTGHWSVHALFTSDDAWLYAEACRENQTKCPDTLAIVQRIPGLLLAGFSKLGGDSCIKPHVDYITTPSVRCHLGLLVGERAGMRMAGEERGWNAGECMLFDGSVEHEVANFEPKERVVLLVDVDQRRAHEPF